MRMNSTDSSSIANLKLFASPPQRKRQQPLSNTLHTGVNAHERHPNDLGSEADSLLHSLVSHDEHRIGSGPHHVIY